jgi:hypothetical protein
MSSYNVTTDKDEINWVDFENKQENRDDYARFLINTPSEHSKTKLVEFYNPPNENFKYGFLVGETYAPTDLLYFDESSRQSVPKNTVIIYGKKYIDPFTTHKFTIKGGKRKTRRNRKSKKSIKGKSRKSKRKTKTSRK